MLVFAGVARAGTTTVGLEVETFAPSDAAKASVVNNTGAYGGKAYKLTSRGQIVTDVDSGAISRISMRTKRDAGGCSPNVELLTRHKNANDTWDETV